MRKDKPELKPLGYSITDTARLLGRSRDVVYRLIRDGELEASRVGDRPLVTMASIELMLERNRISA